jgi:hypothetical protein
MKPRAVYESTAQTIYRMMRRATLARNKLGFYARLRGFEPTSIWSREVNPDGTGEHLHVIAHLDKRAREVFRASWPAFSGTLTKPAILSSSIEIRMRRSRRHLPMTRV